MLKQNILLIIILICAYSNAFAQCPTNSGPTEPCDPCEKYPYRVCVYDEETYEMEQVTVCTARPDLLGQVAMVNLPIRVDLPLYDESYGTGFHCIDGFLNWNDLETAANKWNCICGTNTEDIYFGTTISADFSSDWKKFKDPYTDKSVYDKDHECYQMDGTILFNMTTEFVNAKPSFDNPKGKPEGAVSQIFMNDYLIMWDDHYKRVTTMLDVWSNVSGSGITKNYKIYNFVDVAMQAIGSVLGMGYSPDCGCDENSIMAPDGVKQVNEYDNSGNLLPQSSYRGLGGANNLPEGDCDKCMFKTLYCPAERCTVSVYNYQPTHTNLFPNPSHDFVGIEFELEAYSENVTIKIMDGLGRILLTPIENKTYNSGVHTEQINVKGFENGYYYMLIQTPTKSFVRPFIVIK